MRGMDFGDLCLDEDPKSSKGDSDSDREEDLKTDKHRADIVKKSDQNMSKGEMMQIIES